MKRLYLDNAATSSPKPDSVWRAMSDYAIRLGGSPGRGAYFESREAGRLMDVCRERVRQLINGESSEHVVFALNTSDALNLAIKGLLLPRLARGERVRVLTTRMEHNSVLRPLHALGQMFGGRIGVTYVEPDPVSTRIDPGQVREALRNEPETSLVAVNHVSNVTGAVQPIEAIGRVCRELGVPLLVDGAQSLGHVPVDVRAACIDLLAFPGHKGLLGPTGTGGLYLRPGMERVLASVREGGTGSRSELAVQPDTLPDKYEPGSQNAIGIIGLSEGVRFLQEFRHAGLAGVEAVAAHERELIDVFFEGVGGMLDGEGVRLLGPVPSGDRIGVFTFWFDGADPHAVAAVLESEFGVLSRAGLHCAPLAHRMLASDDGPGGGLRLSFGPFLSVEDARAAAAALVEVAESFSASRK
ncbi:MAG: aminotransferase class V-fold PLP-dependent enzyme [Phycisphaerae bacterium]|nr:aminotransferase class V-fold PLP-dependent enzyme [Phycisphaerae bacterium]